MGTESDIQRDCFRAPDHPARMLTGIVMQVFAVILNVAFAGDLGVER